MQLRGHSLPCTPGEAGAPFRPWVATRTHRNPKALSLCVILPPPFLKDQARLRERVAHSMFWYQCFRARFQYVLLYTYCSKCLHLNVLWGKILLHSCALSYYGVEIPYEMGKAFWEGIYAQICAVLSFLRGILNP